MNENVRGRARPRYGGGPSRVVLNREQRLEVMALYHWKQATLGKAWNALVANWSLQVDTSLQKEQLADQAWKHRLSHQCFQEWCKFTYRRREKKALEEAALNVWARTTQRKAFEILARESKLGRIQRLRANRWKLMHSKRRAFRMKAHFLAKWKYTALNPGVMAAIHFKSRLLRKTYFKWQELHEAGRTTRQKYRRAKTLADERLMLNIFTAWRDVPREYLAQREANLEETAICHEPVCRKKGAVLRLRHNALRRRKAKFNIVLSFRFRWIVLVKGIFDHWARLTEPRLARIRSMLLAEHIVCRKRLEGALCRWKAFSETERAFREVARLALEFWARKMLGRFFGLWAEGVVLEKRHRNFLLEADLHASRRRGKLALHALRETMLRHRLWKEGQRLWTQKTLRHAMRKLQHLAHEQRRNLQWQRLVIMRRVRRAFKSWTRWCSTHRDEQIALLDRAEQWRKFTWNKHLVYLSLNKLRENAKHRLSIRASERQVRQLHLRHRKQFAFACLQIYANANRLRKALHVRAFTHRLAELERGCFERWKSYIFECKSIASLTRKAEAFHDLCITRNVFMAWRSFMEHRKEKTCKRQHALCWRHRFLARAGASAWLEAGSGLLAFREEVALKRETDKATALANRVRHIAMHWRDLALRRKLRQHAAQSLKADTFVPVMRPFLKQKARSTVFQNNPAVHRQTSTSFDWLDRLGPQAIIGEKQAVIKRPEPRRARALIEEASPILGQSERPIWTTSSARIPDRKDIRLQHSRFTRSTRSGKVREQSPHAASDLGQGPLEASSLHFTSGMSVASESPSYVLADEDIRDAATIDEASIRERLLAFAALKERVAQDKRDRDRIREELTSEGHRSPLGVAKVVALTDALTEMQERRRRYKSERQQVLALVRSLMTMTSSAA